MCGCLYNIQYYWIYGTVFFGCDQFPQTRIQSYNITEGIIVIVSTESETMYMYASSGHLLLLIDGICN